MPWRQTSANPMTNDCKPNIISLNTFGQFLRLTTFGESHGPAIGGILDGMPPRIPISLDAVQAQMDRRRPGSGRGRSARREPDRIRILSGLSADRLTLGSPIAFMIENKDAKPEDYARYADKYRPNHADYTYQVKYGIREAAGGGRASARETANWVAAGAIARHLTDLLGISAKAWMAGVGPLKASDIYGRECDAEGIDAVIEDAAKRGDSVGGLVACRISGVPAGLGDPVFGKLQSRLAAAMMGINAAKSFEYGLGREAAEAYGSETADIFVPDKDAPAGIRTLTNFSGGIQGGISNGNDICFAVAFKPTPTVMIPQPTVDTKGNSCTLQPAGRHDVCVALRAVPVVEAMAILVMADAAVASGLRPSTVDG